MPRTFVAFALAIALASPAHADRLKDVADVRGVRPNKLLGYGLVVGLGGTGDDTQARFGADSVVTLLERLGVHVDKTRLMLRNVAAVVVTTELPAFAAAGQSLDVTVSSIGNATSLEGGTLLATPLKGADLNVYAVAQGPLLVGGYLASGRSGSGTKKNHTTVGLISNGATVERELPLSLDKEELAISLHVPDFTTASRIVKAVNTKMAEWKPADAPSLDGRTEADKAAQAAKEADAAKGATDAAKGAKVDDAAAAAEKARAAAQTWKLASARDAGTVLVPVPKSFDERVPAFIAELEVLEVTPDVAVRVVVNERTGTVVLGEGVRIDPVAIAHGGLTLEVKEQVDVSQPQPFAKGGKTVVVPNTQMTAVEKAGGLREVRAGASLSDVVKALNALDVSPRDLVAILQALKAAGALHAELEIQ